MGIIITMDTDWYTYWINPGDAGMAPDFELLLPAGLALSEIHYPVPERFESEEVVSFGYKDSAMIIFSFVNNLIEPGPYKITMKCNWLACKEICLPVETELSYSLNISGSSENYSEEVNPLFKYFEKQIPLINNELNTSISSAGDFITLNIRTENPDFGKLRLTEIFPYENGVFRNIPSPMINTTPEGFHAKLQLEEGASIPALPMKFLFVFYDSENKKYSFENTLNQ